MAWREPDFTAECALYMMAQWVDKPLLSLAEPASVRLFAGARGRFKTLTGR